jgi:opacity protein-like surface antigen
MKRLISAALALSLLGATAASAAPVNHATQVQYRSERHRGGDNGAAIAAGIGFVALAAILASQNNHRDYDRDDWGRRDDDRGYGYGNSYQGYNRGYGNGYYNNGYGDRGR